MVFYTDAEIELWGVKSKIKVISNWGVSVEPTCLNKLAKIMHIHTAISANYNEYNALMSFLTESGISLLELIDLKEVSFSNILESIYSTTNTSYFK